MSVFCILVVFSSDSAHRHENQVNCGRCGDHLSLTQIREAIIIFLAARQPAAICRISRRLLYLQEAGGNGLLCIQNKYIFLALSSTKSQLKQTKSHIGVGILASLLMIRRLPSYATGEERPLAPRMTMIMQHSAQVHAFAPSRQVGEKLLIGRRCLAALSQQSSREDEIG